MIAGKGHEQGQEFAGGRKVPFDDAQVARAALRALRVRDWSAARVAAAAGATPARRRRRRRRARRGASIDSRARRRRRPVRRARAAPTPTAGASPRDALAAGAWGVLAAAEHLEPLASAGAGGVLLAADDPLAALGAAGARLAARARRAGRRDHRLDRQDLDQGHPRGAARARRSRRSRARATATPRSACRSRSSRRPPGTQALVLELAMRGAGQIAELTAICEPDVGVIVNIGPAHLELLGSLEAIAAAKAELIAGLRAGATRRACRRASRCSSRTCATDIEVVRFGDGGDVARARAPAPAGVARRARRAARRARAGLSRARTC